MVSRRAIDDFLAQRRLAFVGVSHDPREFSASVYRAMRDRGYDLVPVNPRATEVEGDPCVASVADIDVPVGGALIMVPAAQSAAVVDECIAAGISRIWLHQGAGPSSVSDEAVRTCREQGVDLVDGACPMMFLEDAAWIHRAHRWGRERTGHLTP